MTCLLELEVDIEGTTVVTGWVDAEGEGDDDVAVEDGELDAIEGEEADPGRAKFLYEQANTVQIWIKTVKLLQTNPPPKYENNVQIVIKRNFFAYFSLISQFSVTLFPLCLRFYPFYYSFQKIWGVKYNNWEGGGGSCPFPLNLITLWFFLCNHAFKRSYIAHW